MATQDTLQRRGLMFILSSPSGAGKTTIARRLLSEEGPHLRMSVSITTRPIRPGEVEGSDYFFVDRDEFDRRVEADDFFEWAEVFGHCYGTPTRHRAQGDVRIGPRSRSPGPHRP